MTDVEDINIKIKGVKLNKSWQLNEQMIKKLSKTQNNFFWNWCFLTSN